MRYLIPLLLILLSACEGPSQNNPTLYGSVTVFFSSDWLPADQARLRQTLTNLSRLGPDFVVTESASLADVVVQRFESPGCVVAGRHFVGTRVAQVDSACTQGDTAFRTALAHEIGHVLRMGHICREDQEVESCSPVGVGPAIMNPYLWEGEDPLAPVPSTDIPTELDLAEFRRVRRMDSGS